MEFALRWTGHFPEANSITSTLSNDRLARRFANTPSFRLGFFSSSTGLGASPSASFGLLLDDLENIMDLTMLLRFFSSLTSLGELISLGESTSWIVSETKGETHRGGWDHLGRWDGWNRWDGWGDLDGHRTCRLQAVSKQVRKLLLLR